MFKLSETESSNHWLQHRTWTRVGETHLRTSALQNQFALAELGLNAATSLTLFRSWLWAEMQDERGVVWREMAKLVNAAEAGEEVEIRVPTGAEHGDVIVRALLWLAQQTTARPIPKANGSVEGVCVIEEIEDGVLDTQAKIEAKHLVWVTGKMQSRIGIIWGWGQVYVPEFGVMPLRDFRWVDRKLAQCPQLQAKLGAYLDAEFEKEADATPVEYEPTSTTNARERLDESDWFWHQDEADAWQSEASSAIGGEVRDALIETLAYDTESVEAVVDLAQWEEPVREAHYKRPPNNAKEFGEKVRPVYLHKGTQTSLKVRTPKAQRDDDRWYFANKDEAAVYRQTFTVRPDQHQPQTIFDCRRKEHSLDAVYRAHKPKGTRD